MNIKKDYESNDDISSATEAMDASMGFIFEKFIEPSEADLSENDLMSSRSSNSHTNNRTIKTNAEPGRI